LEQLVKQDPIAMGMLGKQAVLDRAYRPLTYVLIEEEANKKIYYNLLTHELITVPNSELESQVTRKYLIENWYLVPEENDDQQLVDECRAVLTLKNSWPKKIHIFHIFTTLDCNARCFYCFEKRIPESNMTKEIASKAIEYMQEKSDGKTIKIGWFGGEPLFNYPIIDFISCKLRERGAEFESSMTSNGLLFNGELIERAKDLWNLKKVQITLDGTRKIYNSIKAYITNDTDPFEKVIQNIRSLLRAEIHVSIRLNVGMHNYSDIRELIDFLCENFRRTDNISVYASPLHEVMKYEDNLKFFIYDFLDEQNNKINCFFGKRIKENTLSGTIVNSACMASGREAVTILPDGKIGICTGVTYDALLGDIFTNSINESVRTEFGRRFYREDKCRCCQLYPNCYIANGCPTKDEREGCDPVKIQRQIRMIREDMKSRCRRG